MDEQQRSGEELFERLNWEKKQRRRKVVRTIIIVIAVIAVALVLLVLSLRRSVEKKFAAAEKEVLTYYLQGYDYIQIAELMGKEPKSIDNALQRLKKKLKYLI